MPFRNLGCYGADDPYPSAPMIHTQGICNRITSLGLANPAITLQCLDAQACGWSSFSRGVSNAADEECHLEVGFAQVNIWPNLSDDQTSYPILENSFSKGFHVSSPSTR